MARSRLTETSQDLIQDGGSVLFSFVQGEQVEYPVNLDFLPGTLSQYTIRAVIVQAQNVNAQTDRPGSIQPAGRRTILAVRNTTYVGAWNSGANYTQDDVALFNGKYWLRLVGTNDGLDPEASPLWILSARNRVFIQFPKTVSIDWAVKPIVGSPVFGFIELEVKENAGGFPRTWKPVRGMIELLFSPTLD